MERRALFGLTIVTLVSGEEAPSPSQQIPDNVRDELIARYIGTPDGRQRLVEGAKWALNRLEEDGTPQQFARLREVLIQMKDRMPLGEAPTVDLQACIDRCLAA